MPLVTRLRAVALLAALCFFSCGSGPEPPHAARGAAGTVYVVDEERFWSAVPGFKAEYLWVGFDSHEQWSKIISRPAGSTVWVGGQAVRDSSAAGFHLDPATTLADVGGVPEDLHPIGDVAKILEPYPPGQGVFVLLVVRVVSVHN